MRLQNCEVLSERTADVILMLCRHLLYHTVMVNNSRTGNDLRSFQKDRSLMFLCGDYRKMGSDGRPFRSRRGVDVKVCSLKELRVNNTLGTWTILKYQL
jgi:hypothetical protein